MIGRIVGYALLAFVSLGVSVGVAYVVVPEENCTVMYLDRKE